MIAPLILILVLIFIASLFIIASVIIEATTRLKCKRETKQQVYGIINEFAHDIKDLSIASKHTDKSIDPIKVLNLLQEKIDKIDKI